MDNLTIREHNLRELILDHYPQSLPQKVFTWSDFEKSMYKEEILFIYQQLSGQKNSPNIKLPSWFIEIEGLVIVLDEQLHFNRYRALTLRSSIYQKLPHFPKAQYSRYCNQKESECLKTGGVKNNWTSQFAEIQFGASSERLGDLKGLGASAWKLRAFKDYLQDVSSLLSKDYKVLRLSIWDQIMTGGQLKSFNDMLLNPNSVDKELLLKNIQRRINTLLG